MTEGGIGNAGKTGKAKKDLSPRSIAWKSLIRVHRNQAFSNLLVPQELSSFSPDELGGRDRAAVTDMVYGTLRWQGFLDAVIADVSFRPLKRIEIPVLDAARLGVYQLLFLGSPDYAAVSQTVGLLRRGGRSDARAAGFVNALLRKVATRSRQEWEAVLTSRIPKADSDARLALRYSHPNWVVGQLRRSWEAAAYEDRADDQLAALLSADNEPADVTLCARPGLISREELIAQLEGISAGRAGSDGQAVPGRIVWGETSFSPYGLRIKGVNPHDIPAVRQGLAGVEDEGSQLAALAVADVDKAAGFPTDLPTDFPVDLPADSQSDMTTSRQAERWLDMCAGPGGKTALLAACALSRSNSGRLTTLLANEPTHHRADLVRDNLCAFTGMAPASSAAPSIIEGVEEKDGRQLGDLYPQAFDRILVDAPCSGLGSLRRRPESRWRKKPEEIASLSLLQGQLLDSAYEALAPGGYLAYVTCSPVLEETRLVVDAFLGRHQDLIRLDARQAFPSGTPLPAAPGDVQLFEQVHGTDQMFISLMRKAV